MPERDAGTEVAYSLSRGWTVPMPHLLPEEHKNACGDRTDGQMVLLLDRDCYLDFMHWQLRHIADVVNTEGFITKA